MKEPFTYQHFLLQITNWKNSGLSKEEKECFLALNSYLGKLEQMLEEGGKTERNGKKILLAKKNLKIFSETVRSYKRHYSQLAERVVDSEVRLFVGYVFREIENFLKSFSKPFKLKLDFREQENEHPNERRDSLIQHTQKVIFGKHQ